MKPTAAYGLSVMCIFLVIQMTASYVTFTFYHYCGYQMTCSIIIRLSENAVKSFRDCLCSASTTYCYFYYSYNQEYHEGYYQANEIYQQILNNNQYVLPAQFICTYNESRQYIQCYKPSIESENTFKSFKFSSESNTCDFICVGMISSDIYDIFFDHNNIIYNDDSKTTCNPVATTVTAMKTLATQQTTTSEEHSSTTSIPTTAQLSTVANTTDFPDYNSSQTNTSKLGDTINVHDNITDVGLITGVIFATVAVIAIVLVILFLWRRRLRQLNQAKSKDKSNLSETRVTVSDPNEVTFSENYGQTYTEIKEEKTVQSAETKGDYNTIDSEYVVEYATAKKKKERCPKIVPTPIKQDINMCPQQNDIYSTASVDSTKVVLDHQYGNVTSDRTHIPNSYRKQNLNKTSNRRSQSTHTEIQRSPENQVETNNMKDTYPVPFDHTENINNIVSDNESSAAYANTPTQTTADVYTKLGDQNKEQTNPYNTLLDKSG